LFFVFCYCYFAGRIGVSEILGLNCLDELLWIHGWVDDSVDYDGDSRDAFLELLESSSDSEFSGVNRESFQVEFINGNTLEFALLVVFIFEFFEAIEAFPDHPFFADKLGDVVSEVIWKNTDNANTLTEVVFFSVSDSWIDNLTTWATTEQTLFLDKPSRHDETGNISVLHPFINDSSKNAINYTRKLDFMREIILK